MADRYRGYNAPSGRSATFNPARASLPSSIGYSSVYAGDMAVMPSSSRHPTTTPRGYSTSTNPSGVPTTTRTYAVTQDPRARPAAHDVGRSRRSTLDSAARPPVIITTTQQKDRPHAGSSHSSNARSGSPTREDYHSSDGQFYTQPASSSIRSRSHTRPHITVDNDDYSRNRDSTRDANRDGMLSPREADAYRSARPTVVYPSDPRHSNAAVDYGDDGYQYTNAGELARYDLENTQPSRNRNRDSFDRGYYRPNINYNADQRSLNINPSPDLSRNYNSNTSRPYEGAGRGGPPPSTRGFDKLGRGYDASRDIPPVAPAPPAPAPAPASAAQADPAGVASDRWEGRRSRPVSLYQDSMPRSAHHDEYYRSREDERNMREVRDRDRESERVHEPSSFKDEAIGSRGFGIRTEAVGDYDDRHDRRRDSRREEPKKRSDEEVPRPSDPERDDRRWSRQDPRDDRRERRESKRGSDDEKERTRLRDKVASGLGIVDPKEDRRDRWESKRGSDDDEKERTRLRDKVASGLGIVGTAVGLSAVGKDDDKREKDDREPRRRKSPDEDRERRRDPEELERPRDRARDESRDDVELRDRNRRDAEAKLSGEAVASASDSDEAKRGSRRQQGSKAGFNPNDTNDLMQLKEQLAAVNVSDKGRGKDRDGPAVGERERDWDRERTRSSSPTKESRLVERPRDDSRGRELSVGASGARQVRVVSPPRDKDNSKPVRGILKQPKVSFPEDLNPIREGVAPHKEDKKSKDAPAGARWTKVSRKIVNPEALTIGKERFEVRDDFVIVLRVLNKEEIQAYASATQVLRERRRNGEDGDRGRDRDRNRDRDHDEDRDYDKDVEEDNSRRHHRHHRHRDEEEGEPADRDRERRRRHRKEDEDEYEPRMKELPEPHSHHRSHRERSSTAGLVESVGR